MPEPTTHVLLVTDRSGSMARLADDVCGGYNAYLDGLIADADINYKVTTALFSDDYELLATGVAPQDAPRLDQSTYRVGGMTALLDAVGKAITDFERSTDLGAGDRVLLVVQTDGEENRSQEYSSEQIRLMIQEREAAGCWGAVFMGAGVDTWRQGDGMGFGTSLSYANDAAGTRGSFDGLTKMSGAYSRGANTREAATESGLTVEQS